MKKLSVILFAVVMSVMMVVPAFADYSYGYVSAPAFTTEMKEYSNTAWSYCVLIKHDSSLKLYMSTKPLKISLPASGKVILQYTENLNASVYEYFLIDGEWVYNRKINLGNIADVAFDVQEIIWSSYDLYNKDGQLVLSGSAPKAPSLSEEIQGVTDDTLSSVTVPSVNSVMTILCVTGVGLLSMLVLLKLFGKRSLIKR